LPKEAAGHNRNGVAFALVLAHQDGAGFQAAVQAVRLPATCHPVQQLDCFPVKAAEGFPLEAIRDHAGDDVLGQAFGWGSTEHHAPAFAQRADAEGPDVVDLGLDRGGIHGPLIHG
jgi:hypothetical protein